MIVVQYTTVVRSISSTAKPHSIPTPASPSRSNTPWWSTAALQKPVAQSSQVVLTNALRRCTAALLLLYCCAAKHLQDVPDFPLPRSSLQEALTKKNWSLLSFSLGPVQIQAERLRCPTQAPSFPFVSLDGNISRLLALSLLPRVGVVSGPRPPFSLSRRE